MAIFQVAGNTTKSLEITIHINDGRDSVPPVVETNYTGTTLEVSKNIDEFDLEFELRRPQDTNIINTSGKNVGIGYAVNTGESTINANGYTLANGTLRIDAGDTNGSINIPLVSSNINNGDKLVIDFTPTNAVFRYGGTASNGVPINPITTEKLTITFVERPTVSIETVSPEVAHTDYVEYTVKIDPAQTGDIDIGLSETGTTATGGTPVTTIRIPGGKTEASGERIFTDVGTYKLALADSTRISSTLPGRIGRYNC